MMMIQFLQVIFLVREHLLVGTGDQEEKYVRTHMGSKVDKLVWKHMWDIHSRASENVLFFLRKTECPAQDKNKNSGLSVLL